MTYNHKEEAQASRPDKEAEPVGPEAGRSAAAAAVFTRPRTGHVCSF